MPMTAEQRARVTEMVMQTMYRGFDDQTLEEMISIGKRFERKGGNAPPPQVLELNAALARELERRREARAE